MGLRSIWNLNIDELLVAEELKKYFKKTQREVFFPINAQMKDADLLLFNLKNNRGLTIQVKGCRTWDPNARELQRHGAGFWAWLKIDAEKILKKSNKTQFFVIASHSVVDGQKHKAISINYLVFTAADFKSFCKEVLAKKGGTYFFAIILIDPNGRRAFYQYKDHKIDLSKHLNNWEVLNK